jgi:hypothetical protein
MRINTPGPEFKNPNREKLTSKVELVVSRLLSLFLNRRKFVPLLAVVGSFFEFAHIIEQGHSGKIKMYSSREKLYAAMMRKIGKGNVVCCEFGVAWGYTSAFWLLNIQKADLKWIGLDRFEGLPRRWFGHPEGAFSTGGATPPLIDPRVEWLKGDIDKTVNEDFLNQIQSFDQRLFFFDLDIFEPSEYAFTKLKHLLKSGDVLYFDEARMIDERFLIKNYVLPNLNCRVLGITINAIALEVV